MKRTTYSRLGRNLRQYLFAGLVLAALFPLTGVARAQEQAARAANAPVKVIDAENAVTLENGLITLKINKANANVLSLQYKGMDVVDGTTA